MKKNMKKLIGCMAVMTLTVGMLSGCGSSKIETKSDGGTDVSSTDTTKSAIGTSEDGKLKVGMEIGYPPFEYYDDDGVTPIGVDVELAQAIGDEMGVDVEFEDTAWDGIFAGLSKGDYDCIMSAVTITDDRLLEFDFSNPYIENYQCIVTTSDAENQPADPSELEGMKIAYQEDTTSDTYINDYAKKNSMKVKTNAYAKILNCFDDLKLGRVDAVVCDSTVATSYIADGTYKVTWQQDTDAEEFGVCIQKGNSELVDQVNVALDTLKQNGKLDEILDKYF